MSARLTALLVAVLAVLAGTWLLLHEDAAGEPLPTGLALPMAPARGATVLPAGHSAGSDGEAVPLASPTPPPPPPAPAETEALPRLDADGLVQGQVVDSEGRALSGVPLLLVVAVDLWDVRRRPDEPPERIGSTLSDADGRFALPARAGAQHQLIAGGRAWPRVELEHVTSGDTLLVRLPGALVLSGRVESEESGEPLEGARLVAFGESGALLTESVAGGAFSLAPLSDTSVLLATWAPGHDVRFEKDVLVGGEEHVVALPPGRTMLGTVVAAEGGEPLAGAEVRLQLEADALPAGSDQLLPEPVLVLDEPQTSDAFGRFTFADAPTTGFVLSVSLPGYVPAEVRRYETSALQPEAEVRVELELLQDVAGLVLDGLTGLPSGGATVQLRMAGQLLGSSVADASGAYAVPLEGWDGAQLLTVEARDAAGAGLWGSTPVRRRDSSESVDIELMQPVLLPVLVMSGGEPLAGAQVLVRAGDGSGEPTLGRSDADGRVDLAHPLAHASVGEVFLQARHLGLQSLITTVSLADGPPQEPVVLDVGGGLSLSGLVLDQLGLPLASALVVAGRSAFRYTDASGLFRIGPFEAGSDATLMARAEGFHPGVQELHGLTGFEDELVFELQPVLRLQCTVFDGTTGQPFDGVLAKLQREVEKGNTRTFVDTPVRAEHQADVPGGLLFDLPQAGRYRVRLMSLTHVETTSASVDFDGQREPPPLQVLLTPAALLEVSVEDGRGRPVPGLSLRLVDADEEGLPGAPHARKKDKVVRTDGQGIGRFNLGLGGTFQLASGPGSWLAEQPFRVQPGPMQRQSYRVPSSGDLHLEVRDESGRPVRRPHVQLQASGKPRPYDLTRSSAPRGEPDELVFEVLPPGEYRLSVRAAGYLEHTATLVMPADRVEYQSVVLRATDDDDKSPARGRSTGRPEGQRRR